MIRRLFLAGIMAAAAANADWPQFQNTPANTGYAPGVFVNPASADTVLKFDLGGAILAAPVVVGDTIYAASETGTLYAINFKTGDVAWFFTDSAGIVSTPAADNGKIYVAARSGIIHGLDRMTGAEKWRFTADDTAAVFKEFQAPVKLANNRLYAGCFNNRLYCLDTAGNKKWDFRTYFYIREAVAIKDSLVVLTSRDELLYGLMDQGAAFRLAWQTDPISCDGFGCISLSRSTPLITDTLVFLNFVENDGNFWTSAFSTGTGTIAKVYGEYILNNTGFAVSGEGVVFCNGWYYRADSLGPNGRWWPPAPAPYPIPGWCLQRPGEGAPVVIGNYAVNVNAFNPAGLYFFNPVTRAYVAGLAMEGYNISSSLAASDSALFFGTYEGILFGMGHGGSVTGTAKAKKSSIQPPQVFPNPFNPVATIRFFLDRPGPVSIRIFNSAGKVVHAVEKGFSQGFHQVSWNGKSLPSGIYFVSVTTDGRRFSTRLTLLK